MLDLGIQMRVRQHPQPAALHGPGSTSFASLHVHAESAEAQLTKQIDDWLAAVSPQAPSPRIIIAP
jgi:hypothetical protein